MTKSIISKNEAYRHKIKVIEVSRNTPSDDYKYNDIKMSENIKKFVPLLDFFRMTFHEKTKFTLLI